MRIGRRLRGFESRQLATAGFAGAAAVAHHGLAHQPNAHHPAIVAEANRGAARFPVFPYPGLKGVGPGLGHGLIRLALPFNFHDYGVVTIWNNTRTIVNFGVSASTFNNGNFYGFTLNPGASGRSRRGPWPTTRCRRSGSASGSGRRRSSFPWTTSFSRTRPTSRRAPRAGRTRSISGLTVTRSRRSDFKAEAP